MKRALMLVSFLIPLLLLPGTDGSAEQQKDKEHEKSITERFMDPNQQVRQTAYKEGLQERSTSISDLLAILNSPVHHDDNFCYEYTSRNLAIALLGEMRAAEAVNALLEWTTPPEGVGFSVQGIMASWPAETALVKIGKPASLECLKRLSSPGKDADEWAQVKRDVMLRVIRQVEGNDVARFMLQNAIDKEQDKDKKANLTAALELLDKWIKADAERNKPPENPAPPSDSGTTPGP